MSIEKTIVEINGVKLEVDLRHAKVVHENLKVGSRIKLLEKGGYSGPMVYPGVVVGFEPFTDLPTIIVAYLVHSYASAELKFAYINSKNADKWDIVPSVDDEFPIEKAEVLKVYERDIAKKEAEIQDIKQKRDFFLRNFNVYFARESVTA